MSIYERTRNGKPVNPARALYNYWHAILTGMPGSRHRNSSERLMRHIDFNNNWSLSFINEGPKDRPHISFGSTFQVSAKGEFRIIHPHGYHQRNIIARNTFLRWGHHRSDYNWFVDLSNEDGFYDRSWRNDVVNLGNWQEPVYYVSEKVMKARGGYGYQPWLRLEHDAGVWQIKFGHTSKPWDLGNAEEFEWFERLRQKRYAVLERDHKIAAGLLIQEGRRVITPEEREERHKKAVQVLLAHMEVGSAARTVPLRKTTEEVGLWEPSGCP
jgi:hypothetical protein